VIDAIVMIDTAMQYDAFCFRGEGGPTNDERCTRQEVGEFPMSGINEAQFNGQFRVFGFFSDANSTRGLSITDHGCGFSPVT
jgi:hypothetical protein